MIALLFWVTAALIFWSLAGYGLTWIVLARLMPRAGGGAEEEAGPLSATVLIAARNEEADIGGKIRSVLDQHTGAHAVKVLVVSDGSEDATLARAAEAAAGDPRVTLLELPSHQGKAAALNAGLAQIPPEEVVIFSDANSRLAPGAIAALLAPFAGSEVGGTIGQLSIPPGEGLMARAERLFWRYDNALKRAEDLIAGVVSAQGTFYAVRRHLIPEVPAAMADDLVTSLAVVDQGYRLAYAPGAIASEPVTAKTGAEFGRRLRSTERGWRGLMRYRHLMAPGRTGLYAVQLFSHKALRRLVAFLLPLLLLYNLMLLGQGWLYWLTLLAQLAVYGLAAAALLSPRARALPGASVAVFFTLGHAAMAWAILRYCAGVESAKWTPVRDANEGAG